MIRSAIALALLGAFLLNACGIPPSPSPSPPPASAIPSPSPVPSSAAPSPTAVAACATGDVQVTGGPWGGAAGSRGSDIVVENVGAAPCLLPAGATVAMIDLSGSVLLTNAPAQAGTGPELAPGATTGFSLLFSNWCEQAVSLPFRFQLALAGETADIDGLAVTTTDELPPCNGPDQPATLSTTDWQAG